MQFTYFKAPTLPWLSWQRVPIWSYSFEEIENVVIPLTAFSSVHCCPGPTENVPRRFPGLHWTLQFGQYHQQTVDRGMMGAGGGSISIHILQNFISVILSVWYGCHYIYQNCPTVIYIMMFTPNQKQTVTFGSALVTALELTLLSDQGS